MPDTLVPNLFLCGVPKCGTTSLARWLGHHPQIDGGITKEHRILMDADDPLSRPDGYHARGMASYEGAYAPAARTARWRLDSSPEYYYQNLALEAIHSIEGARAVFLLRDPVERILSMFRFAKYNMAVLPADMRFETFIAEVRKGRASELIGRYRMLRNVIRHGEYARYIEAWHARLGAERVYMLMLEDLRVDPGRHVRALARWLELDPAAFAGYAFPVENESYVTRSAALHRAKRRLRNYLPGGVRQALAPVYRALNTTPSDPRAQDGIDPATVADLRLHFESWDRALQAVIGARPGIGAEERPKAMEPGV